MTGGFFIGRPTGAVHSGSESGYGREGLRRGGSLRTSGGRLPTPMSDSGFHDRRITRRMRVFSRSSNLLLNASAISCLPSQSDIPGWKSPQDRNGTSRSYHAVCEVYSRVKETWEVQRVGEYRLDNAAGRVCPARKEEKGIIQRQTRTKRGCRLYGFQMNSAILSRDGAGAWG